MTLISDLKTSTLILLSLDLNQIIKTQKKKKVNLRTLFCLIKILFIDDEDDDEDTTAHNKSLSELFKKEKKNNAAFLSNVLI